MKFAKVAFFLLVVGVVASFLSFDIRGIGQLPNNPIWFPVSMAACMISLGAFLPLAIRFLVVQVIYSYIKM